jgi:CDGSH iron-sulfur domain-containing protein 1
VPRLIRLNDTKPMKLDPAQHPPGKVFSLCTCGLSQKFPLCDGAHKVIATRETEGLIDIYDAARTTVIARVVDEQSSVQPLPTASINTFSHPPMSASVAATLV